MTEAQLRQFIKMQREEIAKAYGRRTQDPFVRGMRAILTELENYLKREAA